MTITQIRAESPYEQAERLFSEIVQEYGEDYIYLRPDPVPVQENGTMIALCSYTKLEGNKLTADCIIGHLLHRFGVPLTDLREVNTEAISHLARQDGYVYPESWLEDPHLAEALQAAQDAQDFGMSWGVALETFQNRYQTLTGVETGIAV